MIRDLPIAAPPGPLPEVSGITHDSRRAAPGDLFVAIAGERFDGRDFATQAASRGAVAALGSGAAPAGLEVPWLSAAEPRFLLGPLAARIYGHPDRELLTVGVTGTNGKSTVVALVAAMLEAAGRPTGRLGTLGYRFAGLELDGERTTPEASDLFRVLRAMRDAGARAAALEVSSHALALGRVEGALFDLALFTNLTRDHLDFHRDLEDYFAVKRRLFERLAEGGRAVVNVGDAYGARLASELPRVTTFGAGGDVELAEAECDLGGSRGAFRTPRGRFEFASPLVGELNLDNLAAAVAAGEALGLERRAMRRALAATAPLAGRMEPVGSGRPFPVIVDYAHSEAALAAALGSLRRLGPRRVAVVFGCGGERDRGKRAPMGRVAGELADLAVLTSDNPRGEDPQAILDEVRRGLEAAAGAAWEVIPDRRQAIRHAVARAGAGWAVLVAGKGHESEQLVGGRRLPFSDRQVVLEALEERFGPGTTG